MKKIFGIVIATLLPLCLAGCAQAKYPELPKDAIAFEMGEYANETDAKDLYATIEYQGRTYLPYGTLQGTMSVKAVDRCIGYLVQDGKADEEERIYTLCADTDCNYLMEYYDSKDNMMNGPTFWRAMDTRGEEISTPEYVESLGYSYWE